MKEFRTAIVTAAAVPALVFAVGCSGNTAAPSKGPEASKQQEKPAAAAPARTEAGRHTESITATVPSAKKSGGAVPLAGKDAPSAAGAEASATSAVAVDPAALRDPSLQIRMQAVRAAGRSGDTALVEPLVKVLHGDVHWGVRRDAARSLGLLGDKRAVPALEHSSSHPDLFVRLESVRALGLLGGGEQALVARLGDSEYTVRLAVARALSTVGTEASVEPLSGLLDDGYAAVRRAALGAIGSIGGEAAAAELLRRLSDRDEAVRSIAARHLGRMGDPSAMRVLLYRLSDDSFAVRHEAASAMEAISGEAFGQDRQKWESWMQEQG